MSAPWLHRFAILVALSSLLAVIFGADVTSGGDLIPWHRAAAMVAGVLSVVLAVWIVMAKEPAGVRWLGIVALSTMGVDAAVGNLKDLAWFHALLAPLFFSTVAAVALVTSRRWVEGDITVQDHGWPSLRSLAALTPVMVVAQIALGAAFRHKVMGLMPHIVGAMVVALFILLVTIFVMNQFPEHRSLKPAAVLLLIVTFAQVFLGIAALTVRMINNPNTVATILITVAHVVNGTLTMGATLLLSFQIRRNVLPKAETVSDQPTS